jgi:ubiquinone/menaquinone biosynthesis C-methylase UbiE
MLFERSLAKQLANPNGFVSGVMAVSMNRSNSDLNRETVDLLDIKPDDRVLEVGFGGGSAIGLMTHAVESGLVAGIDISESMVRRGRAKFREFVSTGRVELKRADASQIPYETGYFDKACSVMAVFFWREPVACLKEINRVLKGGGRMVLAVRSKEWMDKFPPARHGFAVYSDDQLWRLLDEAGFSDVHTEPRKTRWKSTFLLATKK